ncbi:MAG: ribosome-associated protein [Candidatus Latescibacterota bacterium]|jgi:ribosome-associated protein
MQIEVILKELNFKAIRSSGPGGQHLNKTASKVELSFNVVSSEGLSETEKELITSKLAKKITTAGLLILQCGQSRSQHRNKTIVIERLLSLVKSNLKVAKKRKKTKPSKGAIEKRIKAKKNRAIKKTNRKPPKLD